MRFVHSTQKVQRDLRSIFSPSHCTGYRTSSQNERAHSGQPS